MDKMHGEFDHLGNCPCGSRVSHRKGKPAFEASEQQRKRFRRLVLERHADFGICTAFKMCETCAQAVLEQEVEET